MIALAPLLLLLPAMLAGSAVGIRLGRHGARGIADRALVAFAVLALPPYALGWLECFTAGWVGLAVVLTACALIAASSVPLARVGTDLWQTLGAPHRTALELWRRGERAAPFAIASCALVFAWTLLLTYLAPSSSWDGMWYHDSIVGFAIQNRGFTWVELPLDATQVINGYPRLVEAVAAAFVVTSDATWIELPSVLAWPALGAALVALADNGSAWRTGSVLFACVFLLVPGIAMELRSTYIDVPIDFLLVVALAALTRPKLTNVDLGIAALAVGMLAGAKSTAALWVPILGAFALTRTFPAGHLGRRRILPHVAGALLVAACATPLYLRSFTNTGNPFWPLTLEGPFGIHFEGPIEVVVRWPPVGLWLREMYGWPMEGHYHPDVRPHGYGHALPFLLPPLLLAAIPSVARGLARLDSSARARLYLVGLGVVMAVVTREVMWWGRFGIVPVACVSAALLGYLSTPARRALAVKGLSLAVAVHVATLVHADPGYEHSLADVHELLSMDATTRAASPRSHLLRESDALAAREEEIGEGDVVAFGEDLGFFSLLWNNRMSNHVRYVRPTASWAEELDEAGAKWTVTRTQSHLTHRLRRAGWTEVGALANGLTAWRRPDVVH